MIIRAEQQVKELATIADDEQPIKPKRKRSAKTHKDLSEGDGL